MNGSPSMKIRLPRHVSLEYEKCTIASLKNRLFVINELDGLEAVNALPGCEPMVLTTSTWKPFSVMRV